MEKAEIGVIRELRDVPPAHYLFKIQNFSSLPSISFESTDFEVGGYKWKLRVHPEGNKKVDENDHISLYLVLSKSNELTLREEVNVYFKLFVYNQIADKYLTVQDAKGRMSRFRGTKTEFGFDQLLPLDDFNDESSGYLISDCCIFGAEVFIVDPIISKGECATVVDYISNNTYTWNVRNFSEIKEEDLIESDAFSIGGYEWTLALLPNGNLEDKGKSLGLYLKLVDADLDPGHTLSVDFVLRVKDQLHGKHHKQSGGINFSQFSTSTSLNWGQSVIELDKLNDASKGYLINGAIILEVEISVITTTKEFS